MSKVFNIILKSVLCVLVYVLQMLVFNNVNFFGVTIDIILSLIVVISMLKTTYIAVTFSFLFGIISDILFNLHTLECVVIYLLIALVIAGLKNIYKQDRKTALIVLILISSCISCIITLMYNFNVQINVISFLLNILKQSIINTFMAFVIYIILTKIDKIEE